MDALEDEESDKVEVRGYCSVDNLLDFRMDPPARAKERVSLLFITGAAPGALTVHSVTHVEAGTENEARHFVKKMRTLGMRAEHAESSGLKCMND